MIPDGWQLLSLENIATVERGKFSVRPRNDPRYYGGRTPFVQTGDVVSSKGKLDSYTQTLNEEGVGVSRVFPTGTILVTIAANIGDVTLTQFEVAIPDSIVAVNANKKANTQWLFQYLIAQKEVLDGLATQNAQKNINLQVLRPLQILVPPLLEQCRIAEVLGVWDESIDLLERLIGKTRSRKQGLMQQLLTGKKRFKEFEGSEWKENRLGDLADVIDPHPSHRAPKEYLDGIPFIGIGDISENGDIDFSKVRKVNPSIADEHAKAYIVEEGDIAFGRVASIGKVIKLKVTSFKYTISPTMALIKPRSNIISSFLQYALQSPAVGVQISALTNGSTRQSLGIMNLRELIIVTPSLPEQEKIAAVLSAADEEISTLEKQLAAYKQQKLGLMQQLLTGRIRI